MRGIDHCWIGVGREKLSSWQARHSQGDKPKEAKVEEDGTETAEEEEEKEAEGEAAEEADSRRRECDCMS